MKRTERVAMKVQALLPVRLERVGSVLVSPAYGCVINGILIEGSSSKDTLRVRSFQYCFFRQMDWVSFNLSKIVYKTSDDANDFRFVGKVDELARQIAETLVKSGLAHSLSRPYSIRDLVDQHFPGDVAAYHEDSFLFDLCCATFLLGSTLEARSGFRLLKERWDSDRADNTEPSSAYWDARYAEFLVILDLLPGDDAVIRTHILGNVARNAARLGFHPTGL